jgi:hypothetical protein
MFTRPQSFTFLSARAPVYSAPIVNEETFNKHMFYATQIIGNRPRKPLKGNIPRSGVHMRALIQREHIFLAFLFL